MRLEPESKEDSEAGDRDLVHRVLEAGSEGAFRALYRRHSPRIYRVLLRMLASEADAEDVLQEMWLRASTQLHSFEWRCALATWLTAIAVNLARDVLDRRGRWTDVGLEEDLAGGERENGAEAVDLERAIALLPSGCRAAFVLHDVEGYTHEEIAEMLGYTEGTSKSQVFRARRALRRMLNGVQVEESGNAAS